MVRVKVSFFFGGIIGGSIFKVFNEMFEISFLVHISPVFYRVSPAFGRLAGEYEPYRRPDGLTGSWPVVPIIFNTSPFPFLPVFCCLSILRPARCLKTTGIVDKAKHQKSLKNT
jgi:hypothetical protein